MHEEIKKVNMDPKLEEQKGVKQEDKKAEEPAPVSDIQNIYMKAGSYRLHVYIEEARSLIPPEGRDTTDPVFMISAFESNKGTKAINDVGSTSTIPIGEHIFIDAENKTGEEISNERLTITAKDQSLHLLGSNVIGIHEIDLTYIYSNPDHCILHRWVVLSNPDEKNFELMKGYLKIGVSFLHEEDKAVDLCQKESPSDKDKDLMIPPYLKPKTIQLKIQLLKAESLPVMDKGETLDAYCVARFAGAECKSSIYTADKATLSAYWYEEIFLPVMTPCVSSILTLTFWDHDTLSKDDLVGAVILNFDQILKGKYNKYFWSNIYGAPPLAEGDEAEYMNRVPSSASHWRGRVLLKIWVEEEVKETYKKCIKIKEPHIEVTIRNEFETGQEYEIRTQVYSASALPIRKGQFSIKVEWSGVGVESSLIQTTNGCVDWFETCKRQLAQIPKESELLLPDVFIYLVYDKQKICFTRIPAKELRVRSNNAVWRQLVSEKTVGKIKDDWNAGFVKVRIYIGPYDQDNDDVVSDGWKKISKPSFEKWKLYTHIFQCRDLPAADKNGLADPFLNIYCNGSEVSTKKDPRECTLNPRWYETVSMEVSILSVKESAPIIIYVYDYDEFDSDDIIGVCIVEMTEASIGEEFAPRPKWKQLSLGRKGTEKGEILISFSLCKAELPEKKFKIKPEFEERNIEINLLGLRDLKPAVGWLPVNKAFVRFDLLSLALPGESQGIKKIETQPFESGNDPNINTTVSFKCKMPRDRIFTPTLTCTVHDNLFAGLSQPLIGSFGIDLAKYNDQRQGVPLKLSSKLTVKKKKKKKNIQIIMKKTKKKRKKKKCGYSRKKK